MQARLQAAAIPQSPLSGKNNDSCSALPSTSGTLRENRSPTPFQGYLTKQRLAEEPLPCPHATLTPTQAMTLFGVYLENVAPILPILHTPSVHDLVLRACAATEVLPLESAAVLWAVYLAAAISMTPPQVRAELGETQEAIVDWYQHMVERALYQADFLSRPSLPLMQAAILYLTCLLKWREATTNDAASYVWMMTTVLFRLAQSLALHQDGESRGLSPYDTEMGRRAWWHLCLLDLHASDHQGTEPECLNIPFTTQVPSQINDKCLSPASAQLVTREMGFTDMSFLRMRCDILRTVYRQKHIAKRGRGCSPDQPCECAAQYKVLLSGLQSQLRQEYLSHYHCDSTLPLSRICIEAATMIPNLALLIRYPMRRHTDHLPPATLDRFFEIAVESIEHSRMVDTYDQGGKWAWFLRRSSTRRYTLTFVLLELCVRSSASPLVCRAWFLAQAVYQEWEIEKSTGNWRVPISLMQYLRTKYEAQHK
ncbi:hypothetical protein ASPCADRAFT_212222 [Aspergillus carbonarius ITEM 5010]|uniref:Xylanolytic transcriptional activator regulatory domain-containing protein n=1 Tax=Aspergillus carbonarius (strain ITEM 5010) TaxID=602072 RepID=A0A1R3R6I6_ASPC5|nr:hypothetical protein ASPCADRAFT_212222 [Aspergillus carbonarius ITEM 5010]